MATSIHPTALVDPEAELGEDVEIGAYCIVGAGVVIGDGCVLRSHVVADGPTEIGPRNTFYSFCSVGGRTQDLKYAGEPTFLTIGSDNTFRESCTLNRGTVVGEATVIGSHNNLLAYSHVAHGCVVGDHCIFSNNGTLAGHVVVEDHAIIGGLSAVHQFCRIGTHSMIGGCTKIVQDVLPYCIADGNPAAIRAVNAVGLERQGFEPDTIKALRKAHKLIYGGDLNTSQALARIESDLPDLPEIKHLVAFIRSSQRGIIR
jgi:UDP-N-acetylglucosamine acyltransferase